MSDYLRQLDEAELLDEASLWTEIATTAEADIMEFEGVLTARAVRNECTANSIKALAWYYRRKKENADAK